MCCLPYRLGPCGFPRGVHSKRLQMPPKAPALNTAAAAGSVSGTAETDRTGKTTSKKSGKSPRAASPRSNPLGGAPKKAGGSSTPRAGASSSSSSSSSATPRGSKKPAAAAKPGAATDRGAHVCGMIADPPPGVGPAGTEPNLGICRNFSQTRRRARPSVGRGGADRADCVRDLELRERQVSKQTACRSVVSLALRTGWTVDADGERR